MLELPVAALRLPPTTVDGLRRLGFDRIGELAATPRGPLALRFGSEVGRRLDQMFGRASEPFDLVEAPEPIRVRQNFAEPIAAPETIARYIVKLVTLLCTTLEEKGLGARKLDLLFCRVDDAVQAVRVGTAKPVRDAKWLTRLLCDRVETVSPGFGIETMILSATLADTCRGAARLGHDLGVRRDTYIEAVQLLGREGAALALCITAERQARGEIRRTPESYFAGMTERARTGQLDLARTLWAFATARREPGDLRHNRETVSSRPVGDVQPMASPSRAARPA